MTKFGAALHVIEDYFAHTNFVEIAVAKVNNDRVFPWVDVIPNHTPYAGAIDFNYDKFARLKPKEAGIYLNLNATPSVIGKIKVDESLNIRPNQIVRYVPIVTGSFGDLDMLASLLPLIEEKFFSIEIKPYSESTPGERTINDVLILEICRDLDEAQGLDGFGKNDGSFVKRLNDLLEIRDGITSAKNTLPKFMREYAHNIMERIGALINFGFYSLLKLSGSRILEAQLLLQEQIAKAEKGDIAIGTDPTHTQIAKDDPSKPLHEISAKLAVIAVKKVSRRMIALWIGKGTITSVINEVDNIMKHPAVITWQDKVVLDWAKKNPQKVCDASTPSVVIDSIIHGLEEMNEFNKKLIRMAEGKAGGVIGKGFTTMDSIIKEYDKDGSLLKNCKQLLENGNNLLKRVKKLSDRYEKQYYKPPHCN